MYAKILKEAASQLTLLMAGKEGDEWNVLEKSLSGFFKKIYYGGNLEESLALYRQEKCDLVLIDVDSLKEETHRLIDEIQKACELQVSIAAYGLHHLNPEVLVELLNANIAGFFKKDAKPEEMYKRLAIISDRTLDKKVMHAYVQEMEVLCCSVATAQMERAVCADQTATIQLDTPTHGEVFSDAVQLQAPCPLAESPEEDDFEFFPLFAESSPSAEADNTLYQDYYSYLECDDREELTDQLNEIDATLCNAFTDRGANPDYISRLGVSFMRYGNVLLHYQFFSDMGTSILELGRLINEECHKIVEQSGSAQLLISAFCSGLQTYMAEVWEKDSENPKFFNDSIINDITTIVAMMSPETAVDNSDDLVFF